ncbi:b(0,+)-type amino acid transporter 1 [Octopus sinensis]|uniref:b(0,+)-type amino acid transporter 1 n=1 Tax=Octopus sinensis TaxID=2607531 RepID=A0A6P7SIQ6_9MOLL|nr:b(0,+)-type amino acid transporter 1 [Octopus sinensis]
MGEETVKLKKNLGLMSGITLIVGTMIGSGIFISPKGVLSNSGSVALSLIVWAGCGVLATFGALSYAELGTCVPKSGAEHAYFLFAYSPLGKIFGRIPCFLFDWVGLFIIRPTMFAVISLSLGTYAAKPFYENCDPPDSVVKLITIATMLLIAFINAWSVRVATTVQNVLTFAKLLAIAIISGGGIYKLATGSTEYIMEGFEDTITDPSIVALAFYNGLWSFDGWNNLNFVTEELKNPYRDLPLSIIIGIPLTTVCYVLTNIGYFSVMSKEEINASHAVAVFWGESVLGIMAWIMPMFVVMSCFGAANGVLFSTGRLCYVAGREGHFPRVFSYIHHKNLTPVPSVMFTALMGIIIIIPGKISTLIDFYSFSAWTVYGIGAFTVIYLRITQPKLKRPLKVPIVIPIIVVIMSAYLVLAPVIQNPKMEFFFAFLFICSGLIFYFPFVYKKISAPGIGRFQLFLQKLLCVVPSDDTSTEEEEMSELSSDAKKL